MNENGQKNLTVRQVGMNMLKNYCAAPQGMLEQDYSGAVP
jgi:hypothetical protein